MALLKKLFAQGPDPLPVFTDPQLGRMAWSKHDEGWIGTSNGLRFILAYEREAAPTARLLAYARDLLADPAWLPAALEKEKAGWLRKVPSAQAAEVEELSLGIAAFSMRPDRGTMIAEVEGGEDRRTWRIEFHDRHCLGLGFDT